MAYDKIATVYDYLMKDIDYDAWFSHYKQLLSQCRVQNIVEIGAGTGNFTARLLKCFNVHATEPSEQMLAIARSKACHHKMPHSLTFEQAEMKSFHAEYSNQLFDAAVAAFDVLNYCLSIQDLEEACSHIASKIRPNGLFLFDVNTTAAFENSLFDEDFVDPQTGYSHLWQGIYDSDTRIIRIEMKIYECGVFQFKEIQQQRAHTKEELAQALQKAGFGKITFYNANDISASESNADRWLVSAEKI